MRALYNHDRARHDLRKRDLYRELETRDICLFCKEGHEAGGVHVLKEGLLWAIAENKYAQEGVVAQYVGIYHAHVTSVTEVEPAAWSELFVLFREVVGHDNFAVSIRNGDMRYTCATVAHLHAQCFVGVAGTFGDRTIVVDVGYKKK